MEGQIVQMMGSQKPVFYRVADVEPRLWDTVMNQRKEAMLIDTQEKLKEVLENKVEKYFVLIPYIKPVK